MTAPMGLSTLESCVLDFLEKFDNPFTPDDVLEESVNSLRRAVKAAPAAMQQPGTDSCDGCRGTGKWANGLGCNRCAGKGYQTAADKRRNMNYDRRNRRSW